MAGWARVGLLVLVFGLAACGGAGGAGEDVPVIPDITVLDSGIQDTDAPRDGTARDAAPDVPRECEVDEDCARMRPRPGPCELASCERGSGQCVAIPREDGAPCDDGNACTAFDKCAAAVCTPGIPVCECETNDDCAAADDGDPCNGNLYCDRTATPYVCAVDPTTRIRCDATRDTTCSKNTCVPALAECQMQPANVGEACDDADPCTTNSRCTEAGACVGEASCQCMDDADCLAVEDGNQCNGTLYCDNSTIPFVCRIRPGSTVTCPANADTACRKNKCAPATGTCSMQDEVEGTPCTDGSGCTLDDRCVAGQCQSGPTRDCDDANPCTNDGCTPQTGLCTHTNNTMPCEESYVCTTGDTCQDGYCRRGAAVRCSDGDPCTEDGCVEPAGCSYTFSTVLCPPPPEDVVTGPDVVAPEDVPTAPEDVPVPPEDVAGPSDAAALPDVALDDIVVLFDVLVDAAADATATLPEATALDAWAPEAAGVFLVDALSWLGPELCYDWGPGLDCTPVTASVSSLLAARLTAADPLVLVARLAPLDLAAEAPEAALGTGLCDRDGDGQPTACGLDTMGAAATLASPSYLRHGTCHDVPEVAAPCLRTAGTTLALPLFGGPTTLEDAQVFGALDAGFGALSDGVLHGFLSESEALGLLIDVPGFGRQPLYDFLPQPAPASVGGASGWWVDLGFHAARVPERG